ncbi:MAG: sigma-70 family RNA polymerase sigma factor [Aureispira sp.]
MTPIATYYQPIFQFINQRVANKSDAEDLTQDVFYKLIQSNQKKTNIKNQKHWLYSIAKNTVTDYYRKKRLPVSEADWSTIDQPITGELENFQLTEQQKTSLNRYMVSLLEALPEEERQIMRMVELEGFSQKEVAQELGMNYTTVRSKVQRGRHKIKKAISECCEVIQGGKGSIIGYRPIAKTCVSGQCIAPILFQHK